LGSALLLALPAFAGDDGKVECAIKENGETASGTLRILQGETEVASGLCGKALSVHAGSYSAVLSLDGALDGPEQSKPLSVEAGKSVSLAADFATGLLEVRIRNQGKDTAGMAIIRKDGKQVGTLGSGVAAHLSVGTYEVVARYRTQQKVFAQVAIERGKRAVLDASFE